MREKEEIDVLSVYMLGNFRMIWKGKPITLGKNLSSKMIHLLMLLIYSGRGGIHRELLMEQLYGKTDSDVAANNFRAMLFRLRKGLEQSGLPTGKYVQHKGGIYRWNYDHIELELDVEIFQKKAAAAMEETARARQIRLLEEACRMYVGEFLPMWKGDAWVAAANRKYQEIYFGCLRKLIPLLKADERYTELQTYCNQALENYPYEEWQLIKMECYAAMKEYKKAIAYYEAIAQKNEREYHMQPSERMTEAYNKIRNNVQHDINNFQDVQDFLHENEEKLFANHCEYLTFIDIYRYVIWILKRQNIPACIAMYTILDDNGEPMEPSEHLKTTRENLERAISESIRRSDLYTHYGTNQILMLMVGAEKEGCDVAAERICERYRDLCGRKKAEVYFTCQTAWEISDKLLQRNLNRNRVEFN